MDARAQGTAMKLAKIVKNFRVDKPKRFRLVDCDPADTCGLSFDKDDAKALLADGIAQLAELQQRLYADDHWAVLVVLQGIDTSGKDGVIKHVMSGINPQGCEVHPFKAPSAEELDHDFLWRAARRLPERGRIGIFNRSYYEEVIVVRVRPELLGRQKLPPKLVTRKIWKERYQDIRAFERHLMRNGTCVLKFHLRISKEEQRRRLLARLDEPDKRWKFSIDDIAERKRWDDYMEAYEDTIRATSTPEAPWYVIPADNKHFARLVVAATLVAALEALDPRYPVVDGAALENLKKAREALLREGSDGAGPRKLRKIR
jgi:PPK2 family polyphosphate:nucleotide phosphotransferase